MQPPDLLINSQLWARTHKQHMTKERKLSGNEEKTRIEWDRTALPTCD